MAQLIEPRVRYEEQIKALPCVSKRTKIYSLSGTVNKGAQARILIDNYQNGMLSTKDCYLNFTANPTFQGTGIAGSAAAVGASDSSPGPIALTGGVTCATICSESVKMTTPVGTTRSET